MSWKYFNRPLLQEFYGIERNGEPGYEYKTHPPTTRNINEYLIKVLDRDVRPQNKVSFLHYSLIALAQFTARNVHSQQTKIRSIILSIHRKD